MGPREKFRRVAGGATSSEKLSHFSRAGAQPNLLRYCDASWDCLCDVGMRPHFPPTEGGVLVWSSFFRDGRCVKIYAAHLEKARLFLGVGASWEKRAVATACYVLAKAGDRAFTPRPAISRAQLCELVTSHSPQDELALIALIGRYFLLRIPSECLRLKRQQAGAELDSETRIARRAACGISGAKMAIKRNRRKRVATGSQLVRACVCEEFTREPLELHVPRLLCPVCQLWPAIRQRAAAGEPLFPCWAGEKVLTELRAFAGTRNWPRSDKPGTHSFRRGAFRAILEAGGPFPSFWRSSAYQLYLDLGHEEATAVPSGLVGGTDNECLPRYELEPCRPLA